MVFGRSKSSARSGSSQEEIDAKRRNRLSKPLTNKSSTNLAMLAAQEQGRRSDTLNTEAVTSPLSPKSSDRETRRDIKMHLFDGELCKDPAKPTAEVTWTGVACLVSKFEANNTSQQSLHSPTKPKMPFSSMFSRRTSASSRPSLTSASSKDRLASFKDVQRQSPTVSSEKVVDAPSFPPSRRASFQPGTATRKSSGVESLKEDTILKSSPQIEPQTIQEEPRDLDEDALSFDEGDDEDWLPPAELARTETPNSLDYTHLGGLRLGSLHVVNGRASPAASEMSRHLLARLALRRDASSEYGSELGDSNGRTYTDPQTPPIGHSREVSWYSNGSTRCHTAVFNVARKPLPQMAVPSTPPNRHRDASAVAAEYISELPASPYELRRTSSEGSLPKIDGVIIKVESIDSAHLETETGEMSRSSSFTTLSQRSNSPISLMSDTGSVLRTTTKKTEIEDELFEDETVGDSTTPERAITPERASLESIQSWHSPMKPEYERDEAFESAVEFQRYTTPQQSPMRSPMRSPVKQRIASPVLASIPSVERLQPPQQDHAVKSDSGYSSNNSVSSWPGEQAKKEQAVAPAAAPVPVEAKQPQAGTASKFFKPILKNRKTAPAVPTFKDIRPIPLSTTTSQPDVQNVESKKEKPKPKKLQKRNVLTKKNPLFLQSVASVDDLSIPPVPPEVSANLNIRSQAVPELEKTFKSMHHIRNQASMSTMDLSKLDLRFPSPTPESEQSLKHSGSRRRSWMSRPKEDKNRHSGISEYDARAIISDFGTVASSLGQSPYDMAHEKSQVSDFGRGKFNPANMSTKAPRPRSTFDDRTAVEIARLRSRSIKERDAWSERRTSFNDRGGIPGKSLRPASIAMDAPPMPALPAQDFMLHEQEVDYSSAPPPPPKHSPRPSFIEPADYFEEHAEEEPMAPPPPSHSPRPLDISPCPSPRPEQQSQDPWAAQAAMWKARRQSAGEALKRQSWHEGDYQSEEEALEEKPLYPTIPDREPTRRGQNLSQTRHYSIQPGSQARDYYGYEQQYELSHGNYTSQFAHNPYQHDNYTFHTRSYVPDQFPLLSRPLPPGPPKSPHGSRPTSRQSARSFASSLAEELHPEDYREQRRPQPAPEFGRYSGGFGYGYEKENGFGGSAGTRSVSGKADGGWKGVQLRGSFGVDLGDVPVMGQVVKGERTGFRKL